MKNWIAAGLLGFALLVVILFWVRRKENVDDPDVGSSPPPTLELLETMQTALAETENLNPDLAEPLWDQVLEARPADTDALQNLVVTQLSRIAERRKTLIDTAASADEKQAVRASMPQAINDAVATIDRLREANSGQTVAAAWFEAQLDRERIGSDTTPESRAELTTTIERLSEALKANPSAVALVGQIEESMQLASDPIDGITREEAAKVLGGIIAATEASTRNLFVAATAMQFALIAEDPRAAEIAEKVQEMTLPFNEIVQADAGSFDLDTLGDQIAAFVREGNFRRASALQRPWMNLLRGTEMMKVDRKRANPNVLDFVATRSTNQIARQLAAEAEMPVSANLPKFSEPVELASGIEQPVAITAVDFDLTLPSEIAVAGNEQVVLMQQIGDAWQPIGTHAVKPGTRGILTSDLFVVDGSDTLKIKRPIVTANSDDMTEEEIAVNSLSHGVYPSLLVYGQQGVEIIRIDGRPGAESVLLGVDRKTGLEEITEILAIEDLDIDADGDLDLVISSQTSGVSIWINRGDMTFFPVTRFSTPPTSESPVIAFAIGDIDRDLDVDVVTMQQNGQVGWLENLLHLQMRWQPFDTIPQVDTKDAAGGVAVVEWDGNVSWDILYSGIDQVGVQTTETTAASLVKPLANESRPLTASDTPGGGRLLAQDLDNDSWTDLIMFGDQGVSVLQGGPEKLELLKLEKIAAGKIDGLTLAEMNGDGLYDLCYISGGKLLFAANITSDAGNYIDVQMKGIDDNATGRVNHFAIGSVFELRFGPHYRAKTVTERTTHFGIGKLDAADTLRAILTNGITQNIIDPKINVTLVEEQTNKGSCPFLYGWDGEKFAFVTDCLWAAPLGLQYAMGKVIPDRPWEYLKVDGKFLSPRDGHYEIRLTEELWEVAYFDHVSLIAVDHPADVEIWTNEKVGPPDVVQPTTFAIRNGRKVVSAVDTSGNDCASLLENRDQQYVKGFDQRLRLGLCPPHWVDLDLGPVEANDRVLLIMTGWILPTDTSLNIQIDQNPNLPAVEPPAVWIPGQGSEGSKTDGEWELAIPAMGFPGGKTKTIVVDLTGKLNADDPRVRIKTNAQIYWDAAEVVVNPESVEVVSTALTMVDARVAYRGFSAILRHDIHQSPRYDYHQASKAAKWPPLAGRVTREGDCLSMLAEWDDEMVVLGSGDEIQIRFEVPTDPLPEGWTRDFVLHSVGWDKDADLNTLHGQNIGPLPFKAMTAYPPKPSDADAAERVERINEWQLTREQNFRKFWYKPVLN